MNPHGQIVNRTRSGGKSVSDVWVKLFRENTAALERKEYSRIRTDAELVAAMLRAFPDRTWSACLRDPARCRAAYNRGKWCEVKVECPRFERDDVGKLRIVSARGALIQELE